MVAFDASTHIKSNPLLVEGVYTTATVSKEGMAFIEGIETVHELVEAVVSRPVGASFRHAFPLPGQAHGRQ